MKKLAMTAALVTGLVLTGGGVALATHHGGSLNHSTSGASFSGSWNWYHQDQGNGGWHFWGTLSDNNCGDGDNVYSKVKVEGYSPNSFYGTQCKAVGQNWEVYDYQAIWTSYAEYSVCRDRSFPYSDNCSSKTTYSRSSGWW